MVQGTSGCAIIGRGQRNGVPESVASTGASNARDSESICKTQQKSARPTSVIKRDNTAKTWIVRWQFRGGECSAQACLLAQRPAHHRLNFSMISASCKVLA
ncbi:MAG TPA: hypothetical protein VJQ06_01575 [Rhizomicrobium sp.]|nr:hypothetical protein [Rhizomicrobium sp.]